jgi:hypothetical protein
VRIIAACALALVGAHLIAVPVRADQLKMECQVAQAVGAKEPVGAYAFLFDTASGSLSVTLRPRCDVRLMFGWDVKKWKLLFAQGGHAVFYGITPEDLSPVQIFSLNFENPNMFSYWMGGDEFGEQAPQYKANCHRLN